MFSSRKNGGGSYPIYLTYDQGSDALYLYFAENSISIGSSDQVIKGEADISADFGMNGELVGIEVLSPRSYLPRDFLKRVIPEN